MFKQDQQIFNILLDAVSEGVFLIDEHQNIVEANTSAKNMFGYDNNELIDKPLHCLIPKNHHTKHAAHFKGFIKTQKGRKMGIGYDICGTRKDGSTFPLEVGLNPFHIYGSNYIMALVIDITIRKKHEKEIKALNRELEEKIEQRTEDLKTAIANLKKANIALLIENKKRLKAEEDATKALNKERVLSDLKTKFLSLVSHEFKTPLSGILTSTILLSKYKLTEQQANRDKHITTISEKVYYLNNILNDFFSIEKLDTGKIKYNLTTFNVYKIIELVIHNASVLLKEGQKITISKTTKELLLHQDEKMIELSLSNVVHNAIKYSSENSVIKIHIAQDQTTTTFKITDHGVGIPKNDQKNIFKRYFRAQNALHIQGSGIGLNIVKNHLKNIGGSIFFTSKEHLETIFTITVPNVATL